MRILVPVDYADCSRVACRWVLKKIEAFGITELIFQHVIGTGDGDDGELRELERATAEARAFVEAIRGDRSLPPELEIRYSVSAGRPAEVILAAAAQHRAHAIVMGTHGRTGLDRLLLGSVAEAVVRGAPCTVVVVKPSPEE